MIINFVIEYPDSEVSDYIKIDSLSDFALNNTKKAAKIFAKGDLSWCLQTYLNLQKISPFPLTCSNKLAEGCINIIHSGSLLNLKGTDSQFIVCVQADHARRQWAQYHIVQNKNQIFSNTSFIPHWVQPGLMERNAERTGVKRVAYSGQTYNKNLAGSEDTWRRMLEPHGIEFVTLSNESWHNLSTIDVLIGIRSFDSNTHNTKPPSKLFNAWHANIPFIGGNDSAYKQVGTPGEDYLLASTQQEAIGAILQLQQNPALYQKMVRNGQQKALKYTQESISDIWLDVLSGPIRQRYQKWEANPRLERTRFNTLLGIGNLQFEVKQIIKRLLGQRSQSFSGSYAGFLKKNFLS